MDFLNKLKKYAEGAVAQVNVRDGGKTFSSVVDTPKPQQRQAEPVSTPKPGQVQRPRNTATNNPLTRGFSRTFDQLNPLDNNRTWKQRTPTNSQSTASQAGSSIKRNVIQPAIDTTQRSANTVGGLGVNVLGLANAGAESLVGTDKSYSDAIANTQRTSDRVLSSGWGGKGAFISPQQAKTQGEGFKGVRDAAVKPILHGTAEIAPYAIPLGGLARGGKLLKRTAAEGGANAAIGGATDAANQYAQTGKVDLGQTGKSTLVSGGLGAAGPAAGVVVKGVNKNVPRGVYTGRPAGEPVNFVTKNKGLAKEFADDTGGEVTKYNLKPKHVLDVSDPVHFERAKKLVGEKKLKRLMSKTPSGIFSPDDEAAARIIAKKLGFKGVKFDERLPGRDDKVLRRNPYSIGIIDEGALGVPLGRQQGGYARLPFGGKGPAPDLNKEQVGFVNDYAEMLEGMDAGVQGGQLVANSASGYKRTTAHSPFYRKVYEEKGRPPTKEEWFTEARKQIEGGKAAYGASEEYAKLARQQGEYTDPLSDISGQSPVPRSKAAALGAIDVDTNGNMGVNLGKARRSDPEAVSSANTVAQPLTLSEAKRLAGGHDIETRARELFAPEPMASVGDILQSRPAVQHIVEPDTPLQPGIVEGRDLLNDPRVIGQPQAPGFIDLDKAPTMAKLPAVTKPRPELEDVARNIDEFPESGSANFEVGTRKGRNGEQIRVMESVKRSGRGGLEVNRYSPDMPVTAAADDVMKDAGLIRNSKGPVTDKTVKQINAEQRALLNQWLGTRTAADIEGIKRATNTKLDELVPEQHEAFVHAMEKDPSQWGDELRPFQETFRQATDELYDLASANGVNMNRVRAYITHIWDEKTLPKPDSTDAEALFNPFHYGNERKLWTTYADAAAAGVKMKYKDPRKILAVYTAELHKTMADISYIKKLKDEGVLVEAPAGSRPDLREIVIPEKLQGSMNNPDEFMELGNTLYTTKDNSRVINEMLNPDAPVAASEKWLDRTAKAASRMQDVGLSGGIWGTPVNAFAIAQAVKEVTAGRVKGPLVAFARSMTNKQANKYFAENDGFIKEMLREGVPFRSSYEIPTMSGFAGQMRDANGFTQKAAATWDALVSDPTFKRFLPMMQVELYKDIRKQALKKGMGDKAAKKAAGETVRKFYGLRDSYDLKKANKTIDNLMTTLLFAPKYRAAMLRMWANTLKTVGDPKALSNRTNLRFAAGALLTYGAMNAINYAANGTPMWNNPDGKEDKLLLPGDKYIGIPFLSSVATMPRYLIKGAKHIVEGKGDEVQQDAAAFLSYMTRPVNDILTNESWSGRKIVDQDDSAGQKAVKRTGHVVSSYLPTWLREGLKGLGGGMPEGARDFLGVPEGGQPGYQTATNLLELPVRYYDPQYFQGQPSEFKSTPGTAGSVASLSEAKRLLSAEDNKMVERYEKLFSPNDLAITELNSTDRERLIEGGYLTQEKVDNLDRYALRKKQELGLPAGGDGQKVPAESKKMYDTFQDFYRDRSYVHDKDLEKWREKPAEGSAKALVERASGMLQDGWTELPQTNEVAELYADFSKNRKEGGWGKSREVKEKRAFLKAAYKTTLDRTQKEWLGMADSDIRTAIEDSEISKADMDELIGFDDQLRTMGLSGEIGVTLRRDYGYNDWSTSGGKGGRSKRVTPQLGADFFNTSSIISQLNKLLGSARLGG